MVGYRPRFSQVPVALGIGGKTVAIGPGIHYPTAVGQAERTRAAGALHQGQALALGPRFAAGVAHQNVVVAGDLAADDQPVTLLQAQVGVHDVVAVALEVATDLQLLEGPRQAGIGELHHAVVGQAGELGVAAQGPDTAVVQAQLGITAAALDRPVQAGVVGQGQLQAAAVHQHITEQVRAHGVQLHRTGQHPAGAVGDPQRGALLATAAAHQATVGKARGQATAVDQDAGAVFSLDMAGRDLHIVHHPGAGGETDDAMGVAAVGDHGRALEAGRGIVADGQAVSLLAGGLHVAVLQLHAGTAARGEQAIAQVAVGDDAAVAQADARPRHAGQRPHGAPAAGFDQHAADVEHRTGAVCGVRRGVQGMGVVAKGADGTTVHGEHAATVVDGHRTLATGLQNAVLDVHPGVAARHPDRHAIVAQGGDLHAVQIGRGLVGVDVDTVAILRGDPAVADHRRATRFLVQAAQGDAVALGIDAAVAKGQGGAGHTDATAILGGDVDAVGAEGGADPFHGHRANEAAGLDADALQFDGRTIGGADRIDRAGRSGGQGQVRGQDAGAHAGGGQDIGLVARGGDGATGHLHLATSAGHHAAALVAAGGDLHIVQGQLAAGAGGLGPGGEIRAAGADGHAAQFGLAAGVHLHAHHRAVGAVRRGPDIVALALQLVLSAADPHRRPTAGVIDRRIIQGQGFTFGRGQVDFS